MRAMASGHEALFERLAVIGDSVLQGAQNVGVSVRSQPHSVAAVLARQCHTELPLPLLAEPGYPPHADQLGCVLRSRTVAPELLRGQRLDPALPVRNFAVSGARLSDVIGLTCANMARLRRTRAVQRLTRLTLNPLARPEYEHRSQLDFAVALEPTAVLVWAGANDAIEPLYYPRRPVTPADEFRRLWRRLVDRLLAETNGQIIALTIPDIALVPQAEAWGRPRLVRLLSATLAEYNRIIASEHRGESRVTVLDIGPEMIRMARDGCDVRGWSLPYQVRGDRLTCAPLRGRPGQVYSGGLLSYDGLHPTNTGSAVLADEVIKLLNNRLGVHIPPVDIAAIARTDPFAERLHPWMWPTVVAYQRLNYGAGARQVERRRWPIELATGARL